MKNSLEQLHNRFEQVEEKKIMKIGQSRFSSLWDRKKKKKRMKQEINRASEACVTSDVPT